MDGTAIVSVLVCKLKNLATDMQYGTRLSCRYDDIAEPGPAPAILEWYGHCQRECIEVCSVDQSVLIFAPSCYQDWTSVASSRLALPCHCFRRPSHSRHGKEKFKSAGRVGLHHEHLIV